MSLSHFGLDLDNCLRDGFRSLFQWIQNNPTATAGDAKAAIQTFLQNQYPQFHTQQFGDALIDATLTEYGATWTQFRNKVLNTTPAVYKRWAEHVMRAEAVPDDATMLWLDIAGPFTGENVNSDPLPDAVLDDFARGTNSLILSREVSGTSEGTFFTIKENYEQTDPPTNTVRISGYEVV